MWPVLLVAIVAGSTGLVAKRFLSSSNADHSLIPEKSQQCYETSEDPGFTIDNGNLEDSTSQHLLVPSGFDGSGFESISVKQDGLFTFSSSVPPKQDGLRFRNNKFRKKPVLGCRGSKSELRAAKVLMRSDVEVRSEQRKVGRRLTFCLKRRKITKNLAAKAGCCSSKGVIIGFPILFASIMI
ncbi:hypothetical protein L6164_009810 [Bauhinia variegata]|uniref:Uncharacterized protein n=1 Tax=Bauhinia variegata TaxID=167791 RepID=A0ACB9PK07_BAUVA|nr:hypothetical protein L6164_009810 [Bauhinia variegata]